MIRSISLQTVKVGMAPVDGLKAQLIADKATESLKTGRPVRVEVTNRQFEYVSLK